MKFLSIDIETTGLNYSTDEIVEICLYRSDGKSYTTRVKPSVPIGAEAEAVHGISLQELKDCPRFSEVAEKIYNIIKTHKNIVLYNGNLDYSILQRQLRDNGFPFYAEDHNIIDPFKIHSQLYKKDLSSLYKFYTGEDLDGAHGAKADAKAALKVFEKQVELFPKLNDPENAQVLGFGESFIMGKWFRFTEDRGYVFNLGKYKDKAVKDVTDVSYFDWIYGLDDTTIDEKKFIDSMV